MNEVLDYGDGDGFQTEDEDQVHLNGEGEEDDDEDEGEGEDADSDESRDHIPEPTRKEYHQHLTGAFHETSTCVYSSVLCAGRICDQHGVYIPEEGSLPPPFEHNKDPNDWGTFESKNQFETGDFLFRKNQMSGGDIDTLMHLWSDSGASAPFRNHDDLYNRIDTSSVGDAPWDNFTLSYDGELPDGDSEHPEWMTQEYQAWFRDPVQLIRNLVANPDFKDEFDYVPYHEYDAQEKHRFHNFMSGDWAWREAVHNLLPYDHHAG